MRIDSVSDLVYQPEAMDAPHILVFDSGLGGLTVLSEIAALRPDARLTYLADDAAFPYGALSEHALIDRVMVLMERFIGELAPDAVVIACNTASTLVLGPLRTRWPELPFVGTVPAIKPAAALTRSGLVSVLATPGTVARDYTRKLIEEFAGDCSVTLVGAPRLAPLAEAHMRGEAVDDADLLAEIAPCFVEEDGRRTDVVVLACTHYPLLAARFAALAPWPVAFIDSGAAIARRTDQVLGEKGRVRDPRPALVGRAIFTGTPPAALAACFQALGLAAVEAGAMRYPADG